MKKAVFDPTVFGVLGSADLFLPWSGPGVGLGKALLVFSVLLPNTGHSEPPAAAIRPGVTHAHHPSLSSLGFHTPASWSEFISKPGNPTWGAVHLAWSQSQMEGSQREVSLYTELWCA